MTDAARLIPADYGHRVYAGVLGKIIGVYLGRPFEQWKHDRIERELGEITGYVHEKLGMPLVVSDDDISGTFTFPRAFEAYGISRELTAERIGRTWLNNLIEHRTILWWGGMGISTEHTAYLRLAAGIPAPRSGSIATNGATVAEQIGAQIFIDGWAMVAPGDPDLAAELARKAASVSHDGEAIYAAQMIAVMESLAFVESDLGKLFEAGLARIPKDCLIAKVIADLWAWRKEDNDWRKTFARIEKIYGYDSYGGGCHVIPNHALVMLALIYGEGDFDKSLMIVNTAGWDTDCNSGNVGCLLGIRNGLEGIGARWRDPVADRMFVAAAEGGRTITDAPAEAARLINIGRVLKGLKPVAPKEGYRFHFEFPGAVQGFQPDETEGVTVENVAGHSRTGSRALAIRTTGAGRVATDTFLSPEALKMPGYSLMASPTLYPGQSVRAELTADPGNRTALPVKLYLRAYGEGDALVSHQGPVASLKPGGTVELAWRIPDLGGAPIAKVGIEVGGAGTVYLDRLHWTGEPETRLGKPDGKGDAWKRAWVDGTTELHPGWGGPFRVTQNHGRGIAIQGTRDWRDVAAEAVIAPRVADAYGLALRVQGLRRYYALLLRDGKAQLIRMVDEEKVLNELPYPFVSDHEEYLALTVKDGKLTGTVGKVTLEAVDPDPGPLSSGALGLVLETGSIWVSKVEVAPAP